MGGGKSSAINVQDHDHLEGSSKTLLVLEEESAANIYGQDIKTPFS